MLALAIPALSAQSTQSFVVPVGGGFDSAHGQHPISSPFRGRYGRSQQVWDNQYLGFSVGALTEVAFRRGSGSSTNPAVKKEVVATLGYSNFTPDSMPARFSWVHKAKPTEVFRGSLDLPSAPPTTGLAPWSIQMKLTKPWVFLASRGNLVLDITASSKADLSWDRDSILVRPSGTAGTEVSLGTGCADSGGLLPKLVLNRTAYAVPGKVMRFYLYDVSAKTNPVAIEGFGFQFLSPDSNSWGNYKLPLDLSPLGAKACKLYAGMDLIQPAPLHKAGNGLDAYFYWPIPADKQLSGAKLRAQAFVPDLRANKLGLVFSEGKQVALGAPGTQKYRTQSNWSYVENADDASQSSYEFAAIVRFTGSLR
jgi:hypothetical protein